MRSGRKIEVVRKINGEGAKVEERHRQRRNLSSLSMMSRGDSKSGLWAQKWLRGAIVRYRRKIEVDRRKIKVQAQR